jgi:hypothetical protein
VAAIDNCDESPILSEDERSEAGTCADQYKIYRWWTAEDASGNSVHHEQTITVQDTVKPNFVTPMPDLVMDCALPLPDPEKVVVVDDCDDDVEVNYPTFSSPVEGGCMTSSQTLTWTATDNCGNVAQATQQWSVEDNNPPIITAHDVCFIGGATYELDLNTLFSVSDQCTEDLSIVRTGAFACNGTATDCNGSIQANEAVDLSALAADNTYSYRAEFTDDCGLSSVAYATVWLPANAEEAAIRGQSCLTTTLNNVA